MKEQQYSNRRYPNSTGIQGKSWQADDRGQRGWSPPQRSWNAVREKVVPSPKTGVAAMGGSMKEGAVEGLHIYKITQDPLGHFSLEGSPLTGQKLLHGVTSSSQDPRRPDTERRLGTLGLHAGDRAPPMAWAPPSWLKVEGSEYVALDPYPVVIGCNCN